MSYCARLSFRQVKEFTDFKKSINLVETIYIYLLTHFEFERPRRQAIRIAIISLFIDLFIERMCVIKISSLLITQMSFAYAYLYI